MELVPAVIEEYCTTHSSPPSALLAEVHAYTIRNCADAQMVVGPLEAAFLQLLVRVVAARRILEIGTFTGYSALAMAEALPADGQLITCENDPKHAEIAARFFARSPHADRITLRVGSALDTLTALPDAPSLDLIFIDADKENYINYYERTLPRLRTGGLAVVDNVLWYGRVLDPQRESDRSVAQFNEVIRGDPRVECVMLPMRDGVSVIRKR